MANPAPLTRLQDPEQLDAEVRSPAEIDAAHGTTGWNAYEVWRKRVFNAGTTAGSKVNDKR